MLFILYSFFGLLTVVEGDLYKYESLLRLLGDRLLEADVLKHPEASRKLLEYTLKMNPNLAGFGLARAELARLEAAGCSGCRGLISASSYPRRRWRRLSAPPCIRSRGNGVPGLLR